MHSVLAVPEYVVRVRNISFLEPENPIAFSLLNRPSAETLRSSFDRVSSSGVDCSVIRACCLRIGDPLFHFIDQRQWNRGYHEEKTPTQLIDEYVVRKKLPCLGVQHAWELTHLQKSIPFLRLPGVLRIWFYGLCAYEVYHDLTPAGLGVKATGTGGGELRPAMVRTTDHDSWWVQMAPSCTYRPHEDRIAFAKI